MFNFWRKPEVAEAKPEPDIDFILANEARTGLVPDLQKRIDAKTCEMITVESDKLCVNDVRFSDGFRSHLDNVINSLVDRIIEKRKDFKSVVIKSANWINPTCPENPDKSIGFFRAVLKCEKL